VLAALAHPFGTPSAAGPTASAALGPLAGGVGAMLPGGGGGYVPFWALEIFDWRQICKRFHMAQLMCVSVNFQMFNCATPAGFVKDSGEVFNAPRGVHAQGALRYGWNLQLGADHFLSRPSAVVAHRSPLGVAGVPPNVATVRGTAGPEPLAMTPMASEKDSSVVLPQPQAAALGQVRPVWTLEVDPGHYIVVVTVGDRNVGFAAHLEVGGQPVFAGDWIEAGTFKSRCILCVASRGAIVVGPYWARCGRGDRGDEAMLLGSCDVTGLSGEVAAAARHHDERATGPRHESEGSPRAGAGSPRATRGDVLARGTRLVSLRIVAAPLAREVERERRPMLLELNQKVTEARARVEGIRQALHDPTMTDPRGAGLLEREIGRAQAKLSEFHAQKALKLISMIAMCRRVTHPYIYLNGEVSAMPPVGLPDPEHP